MKSLISIQIDYQLQGRITVTTQWSNLTPSPELTTLMRSRWPPCATGCGTSRRTASNT